MISVISLRSSLYRCTIASRCLNNIIKRAESTSAASKQESTKETPQSDQTIRNKNDFYDIVICGGGMVGTAMAAVLGKDDLFKNLRIALIEASPKKDEYKSPLIHTNRVSALSESTINLFKSLGTFEFIEKHRYGNIKHMHVWDGNSDAYISFSDDNGSDLALIVENDLIQASLSKSLSNFNNLDVFYSSQLKEFKENPETVHLKLNDDSQITTKLLIGSDGPSSLIRQKANFSVTKWDYDQIAIVATLKLSEKALNQTAWQRFLSTGPIVLLPLNDEYSSLVWCIKKSLAKSLLDLNDEQFVERINQAFIREDSRNELASRVGDSVNQIIDLLRNSSKIKQVEDFFTPSYSEARQLPPKVEACAPKTRATFPLSFLHANNYVKNRIALIGDAVHRVHPLAGQGVNLGFGDVISLSDALRENVRNGAEIGSDFYLKNYETQRQTQAYVKVAGIDLLNRLYTDSDYPIRSPLIALRSFGLTLSNRIVPLKEFFKSQAKQ